MTLRTLHRCSAMVIGLFACLHITNHLASLVSIASHLAFMDAARLVYRQPIVEALLLGCVAFQIGSGLWLVLAGWRGRQGFVAWLQALSGTILALFLLVHVAAVLFGRAVLHLDTNFYYAAAGMHVPLAPWFFAPYYFLAVSALFAHAGCALWWVLEQAPTLLRQRVLAAMVSVGLVFALLIVLSLAGKMQLLEVPPKYKATYGQQAGR